MIPPKENGSGLNLDQLVLIAEGHTAFQLLWSAVQLGVFDELHRHPGMTAEDLRSRLKVEERPFRILLRGLRALKLVGTVNEGLSNDVLVDQLMVREQPGNILGVLGWQHHIVYPGEMELLESVRQNTSTGLKHFPGPGETLYSRLSANHFLEGVFHEAMESLTGTAIDPCVAQLDLSGSKHLVDAGGGTGKNAMKLAAANPHLRVTIFDIPSVCDLAAQAIQKAGLSDRVKTWPGDFLRNPFPEGMDTLFLAHICTIWSPETNTALFRRAFDALPHGGRVIVFNMMAHDDDSGPMTAALGSPYFLCLAAGEGMLYTWREYEGFLQAAGFRTLNRVELPIDHGVIVGVKP